jgi:hypothetical protein
MLYKCGAGPHFAWDAPLRVAGKAEFLACRRPGTLGSNTVLRPPSQAQNETIARERSLSFQRSPFACGFRLAAPLRNRQKGRLQCLPYPSS